MKQELAKYNENNEQIILKNPFNNRNTIVEIWAKPLGQFTVRAGNNSDFSYTGSIDAESIEDCKAKVLKEHNKGKIFK